MKRMQLNPQSVERRSMQDLIGLIASLVVALAILVLLGDFVVRGATPPVMSLLALTLGAESLTLVRHSRVL